MGYEARGYDLGFRSRAERGGLRISGGKLVVVVVVVVTTVVRVAGANENWPMLGVGPTVVVTSRCFSTSRRRVDFEDVGREV